MAYKKLTWLGSSLEDLRCFPDAARRQAGYELYRVQQGSEPSDWRPMPSVGRGVAEIRVHSRLEHRVMYVASFPEAVYVLHALEKRARKTPRNELELARRRYLLLQELRRKNRPSSVSNGVLE